MSATKTTRPPNDNPVYQAVNDPSLPDQFVPSGEWNYCEIGFMSARYSPTSDPTMPKKEKCSTITVKIQDQLVQWRIGLDPEGLSKDFKESANLIPDTTYDDPDEKEWLKASGIVLLQEHDSKVQFKDIRINPTWRPNKENGDFDSGWQRSSGCIKRTR